MNYRMEKDSLGSFKVPADAYYGIFTARAMQNFNLTGNLTHPVLIRALAVVKSAAARANMELGVLDKKKAQAIIRAADQVIRGKFDDQFCLDMIQAGAGTPFNMNTNEVLANRANELLGGKKGEYNFVNPNDDVNMGQSSNNVIPTAVRISTLILLQGLLEELNGAEKSLAKKAKEFDRIVKVGRTHIQDAVPVRLGQEFDSYREIVRRGINNLLKCGLDLSELGIGGTAIGTGITAHPKFDQLTASHISKMTGLKFHATPRHVYLTQSMVAFGNFASALSVFCSELTKMSNDLMFLSSGPKAGWHEIILPEVEPGSSVMPGKINPSIVEAFKMVCLQVKGYCSVVTSTVSEGNLQLNIFAPLAGYNLFQSLELLRKGMNMLRVFCLNGIKADQKRIKELFDSSLCTATALNPYIGYARTAELVKESLKRKKSLQEIVLEKKLFEKKELDSILNPFKLTSPQIVDKTLQEKVSRRLRKK